jgi:Uma2 family endonuclease
MAPERAAHARIKAEVWLALRQAIAAAGGCEAFPDGMAVRIDDATVYEPDALVRCGAPLGDDALTVEDPVIVVEVLSPSTRGRDTGAKLEDYFRLPSLRHYLIVKTETRKVIHHRRDEDGGIATRIVGAGDLELAPPGLRLDAASLFP